jgi:hypothetical protein
MPDYVAAFKDRIRLADPDEPAMPNRLLPFAFKKGLSDDAEIRAMVKTIYAVARSLDKPSFVSVAMEEHARAL